ncbi:MAG: hypothetical protein LBL43_03860 [Treponema sp.]|jgi:hypothetical protein|nr:hypothetical protein [Treponema sp.]
MERIQTLRYHNEILMNTSLYKYLSLVHDEKVSGLIKDVIYDNFIQTTNSFLGKQDSESLENYRKEMREPYSKYIDKTLRDGWLGIKNNLLTASFISFESFLNHLVMVYYRNFSKLYAADEISVSYSVLEDFKSPAELRNYFLKIHGLKFSSLGFNEKINYIKKSLKLRDEDIWQMKGKDFLPDIHKLRDRINRLEELEEIGDREYYGIINYLCSLIFKLSFYSRLKYGIEFEWIENFGRYLGIEEPRKNRNQAPRTAAMDRRQGF